MLSHLTDRYESVAPQSPAERYRQDLNALSSIAKILSVHSGQRQMLLKALDVLDRQLGMLRGTIMLLTMDENELVVEAARDAPPHEHQEIRYQRGEGITGQVLQTGKAAIVPRISKEPRFQDRIHQRNLSAELPLSFICVPVLLGNEVVGTLSVDLIGADDIKLEEDARLLSIVASMIANDVAARRVAEMERHSLEAQNLQLRKTLGESFRPENIIGRSRSMQEVYQRIQLVGASDATVLIRGESGTGKELVASAIHYASPRAGGPFVAVNCAALSEDLFESEMFGHEKGAFTGALYSRAGRLEEAQGGTLFLDEVGDFSPTVQVKLLRVLQEKVFQRVGSNQTHRANVRILAATNRDLEAAVAEGNYRQDLYYRVNVFPIFLPPLRERTEDIPALADHFAVKHGKHIGRQIQRISTTAINAMMAYHWPGNVRELENCIEYAMLLSADGVIHVHDLPPTLQMPDTHDVPPAGALRARVQLLEKDMIVDALKRHEGSIAAAAQDMGITPRMIRYKIKNLGIETGRSSRAKP